jgi:glycerol-1-phosphate dehydrogenase [NAD(P)+]
VNLGKKQEILDNALRYATSTKIFLSDSGAIQALPQIIIRLFPAMPILPVADENTWAAVGKETLKLLVKSGISVKSPYIFPGKPTLEADYTYAIELSELFRKTPKGIPLALGSGTINDIVKLGAHLAQRPYICVATACSVDGYASDGAALLTEGFKMTHPCPAPTVIIGDSDVMARAPALLTASGYADLLAKVPAGADWILADFLKEDPIRPVSWHLVQQHLHAWLADPKDTDAIFTGLTLCGLAMQYQKDSRPVSGAEHLLSHVWEMEHHEHQSAPILHGIKVGIGTLLITAVFTVLMEQGVAGGALLESNNTVIHNKLALLDASFGHLANIEQMHSTLHSKYKDPRRQEMRRKKLLANWPELADQIRSQLYSYEEVATLLTKAGCPVRSQDIGLDKNKAVTTLRKAQLIRNRYTVLDALDDLGLMENVIQIISSDTRFF